MSKLHRYRARRMVEREEREERGRAFSEKMEFLQKHPESLTADSWKNVWQLPLHKDKYCDWVWSANDVPAMTSFREEWEDTEVVEEIVQIVNGERESSFLPEWSADGCDVLYQGEYAFCVRGWGHLTGCGALNLPAELAAKIQDGFVKYIIDRLNGVYGSEGV